MKNFLKIKQKSSRLFFNLYFTDLYIYQGLNHILPVYFDCGST